jgi:general secretion pathway protein J
MQRLMRSRGFTLIELLVAVSIMAMMAVLSWRSLDGMQLATTRSTAHADAVLGTEAGLGQWVADLDAIVESGTQGTPTTALDWDGRVLRLTRRHSANPNGGLIVVAWTLDKRAGLDQWLRWQSVPVNTRAQWQAAWTAATTWAQSPSDTAKKDEVAIADISQWQIYFYRGDAWTNPLSSAGTPTTSPAPTPGPSAPTGSVNPPSTPSASTVPDGIRLALTLPAPHPFAGTLTRDWARPNLTSGLQ